MATKKHSPRFEYVNACFNVRKTWNKARVFKAVEHGWITAEECKEICGSAPEVAEE